MPNKPAAETVTVSFTLPRILADEVNRTARRQLTTKSDLIRRALMEYLPEDERARVSAAMVGEEPPDFAYAKSAKPEEPGK